MTNSTDEFEDEARNRGKEMPDNENGFIWLISQIILPIEKFTSFALKHDKIIQVLTQSHKLLNWVTVLSQKVWDGANIYMDVPIELSIIFRFIDTAQ